MKKQDCINFQTQLPLAVNTLMRYHYLPRILGQMQDEAESMAAYHRGEHDHELEALNWEQAATILELAVLRMKRLIL